MSGLFERGVGYGMSRLSDALKQLMDDLWASTDEHLGELGAAWRAELRRAVRAAVLSLVLAFFVCAAAVFATFSFMLTFWETHRVLAAWLITAGLAVLALLVWVVLGRCLRSRARQ